MADFSGPFSMFERKSEPEKLSPPPKRSRGRPRKYPDLEILAAPETHPRPRGRPPKRSNATQAPSSDETLHQQKRCRTHPESIPPQAVQLTPRRQNQRPIRTNSDHGNEGGLQNNRRVMIEARVQFEDDRWLQKQNDSASRSWCKPVTRDIQLETVQSFYKAMHDENAMEIAYCVVCGLQRAPIDLEQYIWGDFHPLYLQVEHLLDPSEKDHFQCTECFPRNDGDIPVCHDCEAALQQERIPRNCQVNMLQLKCQHRYPNELLDLSPLEERLIGLYQPCGWITKFQIDLDKGTSGRYRKLKKGHVTVFPNDVQGLCSNVLPHPLVSQMDNLHVCFIPPRKPIPTDVEFLLAVNPQRLKQALVWLKANNSLYRDISISNDHLESWDHPCPGTLVPKALFEAMVAYNQTTEDIIRTAHYVPAAERGGTEQPTLSAEEVLAHLEDRENSIIRVEEESNARLGTVYPRGLEENEMSIGQMEDEVSELTSTGLMGTEMNGEYSVQERLRQLRMMLDSTSPPDNSQRRGINASNTVETDSDTPFIVSCHGETFADSNESDFFPKTFPCLFPWGAGGPKNVTMPAEEEPYGAKTVNFGLRSWAKCLLQRHGGRFATHPSFPFLIFNMLVKSENRRISNMRMQKKSFDKVKHIYETLTSDEIKAAEQEYRETRTTTNPQVSYLLQELSAFGYGQHMSNEQRLYERRKIQSLCLQNGGNNIWYTINPNDLTNRVNMKLTAFRGLSGREAQELFRALQQHISGIQHTIRDPVSSATFFHREISLFLEKYVRTGQHSVFGKVSCYFGSVETNDRGALHFHGHLWLHANVHLPTLLDDMARPENQGYKEQVCQYIDSVFSESCDEQVAKTYGRWDSIFEHRPDLEDLDRLQEIFEEEANLVASRCNLHSCGPTCVKYSIKKRDGTDDKAPCPPCRFKAPWKQYEKTEFTEDGLFHVARNHSRVNRYNKALSVGLRHNIDVTFLPTNSSGLAMIFYSTNYSTKLDTPLWKRAALMGAVFDRLAGENHQEDEVGNNEVSGEQVLRKNDKTRQFLARTANQIFTSRELSSVEVCANLLGFPNSYSSQKTWQNVHLATLYWAVFRRWKGIQEAAGPLVRSQEAPETISLNQYGVKLTTFEAYAHRGPLLKDICFYEYACLVDFHRISRRANRNDVKFIPFDDSLEGGTGTWVQELRAKGEHAVPVITGLLVDDLENIKSGFYCWPAMILLALFVPWERFLAIEKLQGHTHSNVPSVNEVWLEHLQHLPGRIKAIHSNIKLLRKSAEDAKKDAQLWASRSEGDEGKEFDEPEERPAERSTWRPTEKDMRFALNEVLASKQDGGSIIQASRSLKNLMDKLGKADFFESTPSQDRAHRSWSQRELNLPKPTISMIKAAQLRLHKDKILSIEGDDESENTVQWQAETGFGDDGRDTSFPPATFEEPMEPEPAHTWLDIAANQSFFQVGQAVAAKMTLNRLQWIALGLVCEAMDGLADRENDEDEVLTGPREATKGPHQHFQYVGGSGGTGKSWLIKAIQTVLTTKRAKKEMVITATSGTAAAGIGGNTIHSAIGLTIKDSDEQKLEKYDMPRVNDERRKQRWRRRKVLIVDEVSMLGLKLLYEVDQALRGLRGFQDRDFGGMPVVIFTGDFLQFGPIQDKGLLTDMGQITEEHVRNKPSDKKMQMDWKQLMAKRVWEKFTNVVILEEQKRAEKDPFLLGLLDRIRKGQQTQEDMDHLNATCYDPEAPMDFSQGRRGITPRNLHRWDLTLHAALEYGREHQKKVSLFLSAHQWTGARVPNEEEVEAVMRLGDAGVLTIPGIFPYVEGMPIIVNQNKYLGLKVANGSEFTAVGIVPDPHVQEHVIDEGLSIFLGPPCGILLQSQDLQGVRIPHLPPDTIMLGTESMQLPKKYGRHISPRLYQKPGFQLPSRRGLPCVPGFVLTDYKSQSRTMGKVILGLYGRREGEKCDSIGMYVELSRCQELSMTRLFQPLTAKEFLEPRMNPELIAGIESLKKIADKTTEAFTLRHKSMVSDFQIPKQL